MPEGFDIPADTETALEAMEHSDKLKALIGCLNRLEEDKREAVLLAYYRGCSRESLSTRYGRPVATIKTWLHRSIISEKLFAPMNEPEDSDLLAAEYVLGTLDVADRVMAASRTETDPSFAGMVADWQDRLAPLIETIDPVAPPDRLFDDLLLRLFGTQPVVDEVALMRLKRRVRLWQGSTAGLSAIAAALLAWIASGDATSQRPDRFTAVLQRDASAPAMVLDVDVKSRRLTVTSLASATPEGKSYQLWIINPAIGTPRSLGLIPAKVATHELLTPYDPAVITDATYAVTIEPSGGSPTGQPSGTPILSGRLVSAPQ